MKYLCSCGHRFTGNVKHDERKCPKCGAGPDEHIPEICSSLDLESTDED